VLSSNYCCVACFDGILPGKQYIEVYKYDHCMMFGFSVC
jgi:hypothetical protein